MKDNKQNCFYRAALRDVDDGKGKALIQFESKTGFDQEQTWLPLSTIRQVPVHSAPMRAADLKTDTIVEVKCSADGDLASQFAAEMKRRFAIVRRGPFCDALLSSRSLPPPHPLTDTHVWLLALRRACRSGR